MESNNALEAITAKLAALPKLHTSVIAGQPVTRWSELYEIGTWARPENLISLGEAAKRLVAA